MSSVGDLNYLKRDNELLPLSIISSHLLCVYLFRRGWRLMSTCIESAAGDRCRHLLYNPII